MKYRHIACFKIQVQEEFLWKSLNTTDVWNRHSLPQLSRYSSYAVEGIMKIIMVIVHCNFL